MSWPGKCSAYDFLIAATSSGDLPRSVSRIAALSPPDTHQPSIFLKMVLAALSIAF
jgi:hypothetical protein